MLTRSVFKNVTIRNKSGEEGVSVGNDCSVVNISGTNIGMATSGVVDYAANDAEYYTFYKAYNSMMAAGYRPIALSINMILPIEGKEKQIKAVEKRYNELCLKHDMKIAGGHTQFSNTVNNFLLPLG